MAYASQRARVRLHKDLRSISEMNRGVRSISHEPIGMKSLVNLRPVTPRVYRDINVIRDNYFHCLPQALSGRKIPMHLYNL